MIEVVLTSPVNGSAAGTDIKVGVAKQLGQLTPAAPQTQLTDPGAGRPPAARSR